MTNLGPTTTMLWKDRGRRSEMPAIYDLLAVVIAAILALIIDKWLFDGTYLHLPFINLFSKRKNKYNPAKQGEALRRLYARDRMRHGPRLYPYNLPDYSSLFNPPIEMELRRRFALRGGFTKRQSKR